MTQKEYSKNTRYTVRARIDGKWFSNDYVFNTKEEASAYGENIIDSGGADKFAVVETLDPVKLPEKAD